MPRRAGGDQGTGCPLQRLHGSSGVNCSGSIPFCYFTNLRMLVWENWLFQAHQQSLMKLFLLKQKKSPDTFCQSKKCLTTTLGFVSFTGRIQRTHPKDGGKWISPVLKQDIAEISEMLRHVHLFTLFTFS